jgi:hypothetical protein
MAVMQLLLAGPCYTWMYRAAFAYDPTAVLRALDCPTLLLNAAGDPLAFKDEAAARLVRSVRVVRCHDLAARQPGAGTRTLSDEVRDDDHAATTGGRSAPNVKLPARFRGGIIGLSLHPPSQKV